MPEVDQLTGFADRDLAVSPAEDSPVEIWKEFRSFDEWTTWAVAHPLMFSPRIAQSLVARLRERGLRDPITDAIHPPGQIEIAGQNLRETLQAGGLISRHRALLLVLRRLADAGRGGLGAVACRRHVHEGLTAFARYVRDMLPGVSETTVAPGRDTRPSQPPTAEELCALPFPDRSLDLMIVNELFQQLPETDPALREIVRVLDDRGVLLATFPFAPNRESSLRSEVPATAKGLSPRAFQVHAWDLLGRARQAGFADARMVLIGSARYGVGGHGVNGVFVLIASRGRPRSTGRARGVCQLQQPLPAFACLVGLPRSGTTVLTAAIAAHPSVSAVFEPWNGEARRRVPVDLDAGGFLRRFQVRLRPEETTLLIKETATRPRYLQAIDHLLESLGTDRRLIWIHRDPLHTFLSEMAARKAWWGQTDLTMDTDTFARWARRSLDAVRTISRMALRHPTLPIAYERLVRDPEGTLRHLMRFLGLEFDPAQLAYHTSIDPQSVRGDLNLARQPMPISEASRLRRDQESAQAFPVIARSPLFERISAVHRILSGVLESDLEEGEACRLIAERLSPWVDASR